MTASTNFQFGRRQTGRSSRFPFSRSSSLSAFQARIGVGPLSLPGADADIAHEFPIVEFARPPAGRPGVHQGVPAGAARSPATHSDRAQGRPVPQRGRPRATNADEERSSAAQHFDNVLHPRGFAA